MRVIFHIGTAKTGTTAIQKACSIHREQLALNGVLYPHIEGYINHGLLAVPYLKGRVPREYWTKIGRDPEVVHSVAMDAWDSVFSQIKRCQPRTVVISSEYLFRAEYIGELASDIKAQLGGDVEIQVACYLRDPREHYMSDFQQILKASSKIPRKRLPYAYHLKRWKAVGGITIREFKGGGDSGFDVVSDFVESVVGVAATELPRYESKENVSLSAESMVVLHEFRRNLFADSDDVRHPYSNWLVNKLLEIDVAARENGDWESPTLKDPVRRWIEGNSKKDLEELESRFNFSFEKFSVPADARADTAFPEVYSVDDVVVIDSGRLRRIYSEVLWELFEANGIVS
jgi:hypothetical protein